MAPNNDWSKGPPYMTSTQKGGGLKNKPYMNFADMAGVKVDKIPELFGRHVWQPLSPCNLKFAL